MGSTSHEADAIVQDLRDQLEQVDLKTNSEKADVISSADWLEHSPDFSKRIRSLSFESLVFRLKVFLATKPSKIASLKTALQDEGFSIPLERLATRSRLSIFQARLKVFFRRGWMVLIRALQDDERSLVDFAKQVRGNFVSQMRSIIERQLSGSGSRRRWDIQRLRFIANRCLYLIPASDLNDIDDFLSPIPEFAETSALIKLLRHKDARDLLEMPGPAVAAAASIICASMDSGAKLILPEKLSEAAIHSAAVLLLYDVATITDDALKQVNHNSALFLRFCAGQAATHRELHDFSYLDEIRCLQLGRDKSQNRQMLESRFSDGEAVALEALEIGGDYDMDT